MILHKEYFSLGKPLSFWDLLVNNGSNKPNCLVFCSLLPDLLIFILFFGRNPRRKRTPQCAGPHRPTYGPNR